MLALSRDRRSLIERPITLRDQLPYGEENGAPKLRFLISRLNLIEGYLKGGHLLHSYIVIYK